AADVRRRNHRDELAGAPTGQAARSRHGLEVGAGGDQFVTERVLHAQVDGTLDRRLQPVSGKPRQMQVGEPARIEPSLDAASALIVDVDVTDDMRNLGAGRIDALVCRQESDAGKSESMDLRALLRRDLALEPYEAALGCE